MANNKLLLIVDDDASTRKLLEASFARQEYDILTADCGKEAIRVASENHPDALICDLMMPDLTGTQVIEAVRARHPQCACLLITGYPSVKTAVDGMRCGALDYITKPFKPDDIRRAVQQAISLGVDSVDMGGNPRVGRARAPVNMIGPSDPMRHVFDLIDRVAQSRATVLIRGESGTGKELVARAIHERSTRSGNAFVAVSCAALAESLLESELFGHEKNAFTGAAAQKPGRFERAHRGTLFLDEVGEIPSGLQVKLLRVLQEREFERVGGIKSIAVDIRLVAATNRNLEEAVALREFREDLYYRLQVVEIMLPPLRERRNDIHPLVDHFLTKYSSPNGRSITRIASGALSVLHNYNFPGNVRELENMIERAVVLADAGATRLTEDMLPPRLRNQTLSSAA